MIYDPVVSPLTPASVLCDKEVIVLDCFFMLPFVSIGSHLHAFEQKRKL